MKQRDDDTTRTDPERARHLNDALEPQPDTRAPAGPPPDGSDDPRAQGDATDAKGGDTQSPHLQGSHQNPG
jgi:hypothetical protein